MKVKRLLIIQPGKFGDIIICLPIAKWYYDRGYVVEWECPEMYHEIFRNVDYVKPVLNPELEPAYDKIIDLSFGFGGAPQMWWNERQTKFDSFVTAKYELAGVPLEERWKLVYHRNTINESSLYAKVTNDIYNPQVPYALIHTQGSIGTSINNRLGNVTLKHVYFKPVEGYNIFDWRYVIEHATEIHCIDSSLSNLIEVLPQQHIKTEESKYVKQTKIMYDVRESYQWLKSIYKNNWTVIR